MLLNNKLSSRKELFQQQKVCLVILGAQKFYSIQSR